MVPTIKKPDQNGPFFKWLVPFYYNWLVQFLDHGLKAG
jgi:hypothetical protein